MTVFVARRIALAVLVVAGVVVLTFVIAHAVPGRSGGDLGRAARLARPRSRGARRFLGLDRPLAGPARLATSAASLTGNWGVSIHTHRPVLSDLDTAAPATLELVIAALVIALAGRRPARAGVRAGGRAGPPTS